MKNKNKYFDFIKNVEVYLLDLPCLTDEEEDLLEQAQNLLTN